MTFTIRINHAITVSSSAHRTQLRKSTGTPYFSHPVAVTFIASNYTDDEDTIIAALLHDILEDVPADIYSADNMLQDFGPRVLQIVRDVSEEKNPDGPRRPWKERKELYLQHLSELDDPAPLIIALADKIHNTLSMVWDYEKVGDSLWDRFGAPKEEEVWYHQQVLEIMRNKDVPEDLKNQYAGLVDSLQQIANNPQ